MSLPTELSVFARCPLCGGVSSVVRRGDTGVPEGKTGKRMRGRDSDLLYCLDCKSSWRSSQGTLSENLGYDRHGVNLT